MAVTTVTPGARHVGGRRFKLSASQQRQIQSLFLPALKAYGLGYIMDILPAILKALLRYFASEAKRIRTEQKRLREEKKVAVEAGEPVKRKTPALLSTLSLVGPSFYRLPSLLKAIFKGLIVALGWQGMAISCFWAMAGWKISEGLLWWPVAKYYALKLSSGSTDARKAEILTRARVGASFVSSAVSSALALMVLQHNSHAAAEQRKLPTSQKTLPAKPSGSSDLLSIDTATSWIPKPLRSPRFGFSSYRSPVQVPRIASLAPAGHFLSRLTSLTVPASPSSGRTPVPESPDGVPPLSPTDTRNPAVQASIETATTTPDSLGRPSATIDLTLFALVRGLDTFVRAFPVLMGSKAAKQSNAATTKAPASVASKVGAALSNQAEGLIFVVCCAQIMWAWFYHPERLPPTYVKWITNLATMDERLLIALRSMRYSKPFAWQYGDKETTPAAIDLTGSLAEQLGYPYEWGDPSRLPRTAAEAKQMVETAKANNAKARAAGQHVQTDPLRGGEPGFVLAGAAGPRGRGEMGGMPCELVHSGTGGASCYKNALYRWIRGFRMSMAIYFPVHLLPRLLFNPSGFFKTPVANLIKVLLGAARSAAFLATYIVGNW